MNATRPPDPPPGRSEDRRKHGYVELEEKINEHQKEIERRLRRFFIKALIAFAVIGCASAISIFGFGLVLKRQANTTRQIQKERFDSLVLNCKDTNARNKEVNNKIDDAIAAVPPGVEQKKAQEQSGPFRLILEAAVPKVDDCKKYAKIRVKERG